MPAKWQQWMPLNLDQLWSSPAVQRMSPAAFKGYLALISAQWQSDDCTIPNDMSDLAILSRLSDADWEANSGSILRKFASIEVDRLRNDVCFGKWNEAKAVFEARQASARKVNTRSSDGHRTVTEQSPSRSADTRTLTDTYTETRTEKPISEAKASSPRKSSGTPDPIEEIYKAYPRKVAKRAAVKAIARAIQHVKARGKPLREAQVWLYHRVQEYARSPAGNDGEFTPHPATWFNGGRYDDDQQEWQAKQGERNAQRPQSRTGISAGDVEEVAEIFRRIETGEAYAGDGKPVHH